MADAKAGDTASGSADAPAGPRSGEAADGGYYVSVSQLEYAGGETSNPHNCVPSDSHDWNPDSSAAAPARERSPPAKPQLSTDGESLHTF